MKNETKVKSIGLLLIIALATAAFALGLVACFKKTETVFLALILITCLIVSITSLYIVRKHPSKQKRTEAIMIASNYVTVILSAFLYTTGFIWLYFLFFVLIFLLITNTMLGESASSSLLLNSNTLFSIPMATTCTGLMFASHISDDCGTLYLTAICALSYSAIGFIFAAIAFLIKQQTQTDNVRRKN